MPKRKNKNVTGLMKNEVSGKIMTNLAGLRGKSYSCLIIDDSTENKKAKSTKKFVIKRKLNLENYKKFFGSNSTRE